MFYVLDFHSHRFTTCETVEEVNEKLKQLQDSDVAEDEISVINRLVDDCEMSINAYREMDEDGVETVPYMGRTIAHRIWLWLAAFKMAYEALQDTSTERYTQEYLDAIERNTPPRNGAPIGRDSFEWAGCAEELSVCNVAHLLAAAKRTPGYFQVRSALCGMPVIRERYADTMALLNKVKGTDAYDILAQLMQQAEREA